MIEIVPNLHPIFVHFTVALLSISAALFVISTIFSGSKWQATCLTVAKWNLWLGAAITIATLLAGWDAYNTVAHDAPSHAAMKDHRNWALVTAVVFMVLAAWSIKCHLQKIRISLAFVIAIAIAALLLLTTAYKGGELVYRYGLGVISLPQSSSNSHEHSAANSHSDDTQDERDASADKQDTEDSAPMQGNSEDSSHGEHEH